MASTPKPHGNGWRVQWLLKGTREMQRRTVASEVSAWKLKQWVEAKDHRVRDSHEDIENELYLIEQLAQSGRTFGEYSDQWIGRRTDATEDSREAYRKIRRRCIELLPLPLDQVTIVRAEQFLVAMEDGTTAKGRKYAANTRRETASFIRSVMLDAERRHAVQVGPGMTLESLQLPRRARLRPHRYLTRAEYGLIRAGAFDQQTLDMCDLMTLTGMRIGEVLPLEAEQWERAEVGGFLNIDRHVMRTGARIAAGTKGHDVDGREIFVNESAAAILDRLTTDAATALLFPAPEGGVWHYTHWMNNRWKATIYRAVALGFDPTSKGYPTPHDLRHTHVDWCFEDGEEMYDVQGRLGHSSISVTVDQYGPRYNRAKARRRRVRHAYDNLTLPSSPSATANGTALPVD